MKVLCGETRRADHAAEPSEPKPSTAGEQQAWRALSARLFNTPAAPFFQPWPVRDASPAITLGTMPNPAARPHAKGAIPYASGIYRCTAPPSTDTIRPQLSPPSLLKPTPPSEHGQPFKPSTTPATPQLHALPTPPSTAAP